MRMGGKWEVVGRVYNVWENPKRNELKKKAPLGGVSLHLCPSKLYNK